MTWPTVELAEIAYVLRGVTYKREQVRESPEDGYIPLLRATNIGAALEVEQGLVYVPESVVSATQRLKVDDIVLASSSGSISVVGKSARLTHEWRGTFGAFCAVVRANSNVLPAYLGHYIKSHAVRKRWSDAARGTNINNLKRGDLTSTPVPLPPLAEQRRIVDVLEGHLSHLDAADAYLDAALRHAEVLRWGSVAEAVSTAGGREVRLGDIASVRNGIFVSRPGSEPKGVPILRIGAVRSLSLDLSDLRYSERTEEDLREADGLAQPDDLLFTRYNGNPRFVGACAAVPEDAPVLTYPDKLIRVRVTDHAALSEFVALVCSVGAARAEIQASVRTTAGQAGIAGRDLKNVTLRLPDLEAQRAAISAASESGIAATRLSNDLHAAHRRSAAMRRSLLAAAFSGRLTGATSDLSEAEEMMGA